MLTSRAIAGAPAGAARIFLCAALFAAALCVPSVRARAQGGLGPVGGTGGEHSIYGEFKVDESKVEKGGGTGESVPHSFVLVLMNDLGRVIERQAALNNTRYRFSGLRVGAYEIVVESGGAPVARFRVVIDAFRRTELKQDIALAWDTVGRAGAAPKGGVVSAAEYYDRPAATRDAFKRAAAAIEKKKFEEAAALLRQVVEADPKDHVAWANLGSVYNSLGRAGEAERAYERAHALRPDFVAAAVNLGRLYVIGKNYGKAVEVLKGAVEKRPDSADVHHLIAEAYLQTGKYQEAAEHFAEALRLDPQGKAELHLRLAALLDAAGGKDKAAAELEQFLAKRPDHPNRKQFEQYVKQNRKN